MGFTRTLALCALALLGSQAQACTIIAVGKDASADGSVIVAHTDDNGGTVSDLRLVRVPAADHAADAVRPVYQFQDPYPRLVADERGAGYSPRSGQTKSTPLGYIPQVAHTFGYHDADYGMVNEHQLAISESTSSSKFSAFAKGTEGGNQLFAIDELSKLALERCQSARCAIQTMGDLAVEYGYYCGSASAADPKFGDASETLAIADKFGEVWIFHVMAGPNNASAVWAAQRVPDDEVAVIANGLMIREMDLEDTDNFMASPNVLTAAIEAGFWDPEGGKPFDFTAAYGFIAEDPHTTSLYVGRRIWRIYSLLAPTQQFNPYVGWHPQKATYPFSIKADSAVGVERIVDLLKDTYEGTEFDLAKAPGAGPFGYPVRWGGNKQKGGWERPVSMYRTLWSFIIQSRPNMPDEVGGLVWYGPDSPIGSVWLPVYASSDRLPDAITRWGKMSEFNRDSVWWTFHFVNDWVSRKFSIMKDDLAEAQKKVQTTTFARVKEWETRALRICNLEECEPHDAKMVRSMLEKATDDYMDSVVDTWWQFAWQLVAKYQSGYIVTAESSEGTKSHGYPEEWLNTTDFGGWPLTHTYTPPPGTDNKWAGEVKQREEMAKKAAGNQGIPYVGYSLTFVMGLLVGSVVYYFVSDRNKHDYEQLH